MKNYYIQGSSERAEEIKAAFESKGYDISWPGGCANPDVINIGVERNGAKYVVAETSEYIKDIIKTHPDYKELELPVEPKFKVGDWLVYKNGNCFAGGFREAQIVKVKDGVYFFASGTFGSCKFIDENCRLWTIADAKDGDVITNGKLIVIFNKIEEPTYKQHIIAYAGLDLCGRLQITKGTWQLGIDKAIPANKEQRDLLSQKLKENGYTWDTEKKELCKIQLHYDISNFKPFDNVLVRDSKVERWYNTHYGFYDKSVHQFVCDGDSEWNQCIPFNHDTEHLLGTTDMCPEEYINW